jgi:hypothetical protein
MVSYRMRNRGQSKAAFAPVIGLLADPLAPSGLNFAALQH